ncbi:accessory factor UbiK family protein, partial [Methylogaea oryzae]|uniref:accessory factor UbiK family protein n=1 Tax=Methylogaea oryzae TaxID=1295382 RepID=UPI000B068C3F
GPAGRRIRARRTVDAASPPGLCCAQIPSHPNSHDRPQHLDDISRRLGAALPPGLHALRKDLEKTFHGVLQGAFHSMNLVNREEFDVQSAVLARTRAKLESLEAQVAELEKKLLER